MSMTMLSPRFVKSFLRVKKHTTQYLTIAAVSCVLLNAQTAQNYIVGYWMGSGTPNVSHLTHLNYAFASIIQSSGSYTCQLNKAAATLTTQFHAFKASNPNLKILISVGGAGQSPDDFSAAAHDPSFASNCVAQTLGLLGGSADGLDIDWEFPASSDQQNFADLMTALHAALPLNGLLTAAIGMGPADNGGAAQNAYTPFSVNVLNNVNFFNVMTYDAYSTAATTFGAPLYASKISGYGTYNGTVDTTITDLIARGVPPSKLVLGIPFYGISYPSVPNRGDNYGLYQTPVLATVPDPDRPGSTRAAYSVAVPYNQIVTQAARATATKYCDTGATSATACPQTWGQPLSVAPAGSQEAWIYDTNGPFGFGPSVTTFDDTGSIAAKVKYALDKKLAGVMVWELMQDTADSALLNTIANSMPAPIPSSSDLSTYNFETGAQGWTTSTLFTTIGTSTTKTFLGAHSLAVSMGIIAPYHNTPMYSPTTTVYVASPAIPSNSHVVTFHIWIPATARLSSINPFIADGNWNYLAGAWTSTFTPNAWNTFQVQVPTGANPSYLGVEFDSSGFWMDTCYIDSIVIN